MYRIVTDRQSGKLDRRSGFARPVVGARQAHLTNHLCKQEDCPSTRFPVDPPLQSVALADIARFGRADATRKVDYGRRGHARDAFCPGRRLLDAVGAYARDIGLVGGTGGGSFGQGSFAEASAIRIKEMPVDQTLGDKLVGYARHEGGIGPRLHGNPFGAAVGAQATHTGIDADHLHMAIGDGIDEVFGRTVACHAGIGHRVAEEDDELALLQGAEGPHGPIAAVGVAQGALEEPHVGIVAVGDQAATQKIEQADEREVAQGVLRGRRALLHEDRLVAVGRADAGEFGRVPIERFVPGNAFVDALSPLGAGHATKGPIQAFGSVEPLADRPSAQAGARLKVSGRRIGFHADDVVAPHHEFKGAGAPAVHMAVRAHPPIRAWHCDRAPSRYSNSSIALFTRKSARLLPSLLAWPRTLLMVRSANFFFSSSRASQSSLLATGSFFEFTQPRLSHP